MNTRFLPFALALAALSLPAPAEEAAPKDAPPAAQTEALIQRLGARYLDDRHQAQEALAELGAAAEPALLSALDHADFRVRRAACELLGRLKSAAALPRLIALLQDPDDAIRDAAHGALVQIGPPAHDAIRKARERGLLSAETAQAIIERPIKLTVEELLNRCISRDGGWGFYKDQFKDIVALGPAATPALLNLFTTPPEAYEFAYAFDGEADEGRIDRRKHILRRLAGEALADMKDPAAVAPLKAFLESLGSVDPLDTSDPRERPEFHEMAAYALMKLGEPSTCEKLKETLQRESGAKTTPSGELQVALDDDAGKHPRQVRALSRLAALQGRTDNLAAAERLYAKIIELAPREIQRLQEGGGNPFDQGDLMGALLNARYNLACTYAQLGRKAEALDNLKQAVGSGFRDADWIKRDRDLDAIRGEAEYGRLMGELERTRRQGEGRDDDPFGG